MMAHVEFDMEKAREVREKANAVFVRRIRTNALMMAGIFFPFFLLAIFAAIGWANAAKTESRTLYAILYIICIQVGLMMGFGFGFQLRYILLLKEIKQLRLDTLIASQTSPEAATGGVESLYAWRNMLGVRPGILVLGSVVIAIAVSLLVVPIASRQYAQVNERQDFVTLAENGSAHIVSMLSRYNGETALKEIVAPNDKPLKNIELWDQQGRKLATTVLPSANGKYEMRAQLAEPLLPRERLQLKATFDIDDWARREGDEWVVTDQYSAGQCGVMNVYDFSYLLPPHAVLTEGKVYSVSETPEGTVIRIKTKRSSGSSFGYHFKYRLPAGEMLRKMS